MYTIVRIEHEDGFGMFRVPTEYYFDKDYEPRSETADVEFVNRYQIGDSDETNEMYRRHSMRRTPRQDGIELTDDMFCAFDSLETFNALVEPEEVKFLLTKGFKVYMLEVKEVAKGSHQVCFRKEDIITRKDISTLF